MSEQLAIARRPLGTPRAGSRRCVTTCVTRPLFTAPRAPQTAVLGWPAVCLGRTMPPRSSATPPQGRLPARGGPPEAARHGQAVHRRPEAADPQAKLADEVGEVKATRAVAHRLAAGPDQPQGPARHGRGEDRSRGLPVPQALLATPRRASEVAGADETSWRRSGWTRRRSGRRAPAKQVAAPVVTSWRARATGRPSLACSRVPYAGAYIFQYKLEPSQPSDPWLARC